jgi:Protein of unknown function (DUF1194)
MMQRALSWIKGLAAGVAVVVLVTANFNPIRAAGENVDLALILAIDCSFSVDREEFGLQMTGLGRAFQQPEVMRAIQQGQLQRIAVSVIQWSDENNQTVVLPWTVIASDADAMALGERLMNTPRSLAEGGTSISSALLFSAQQFSTAPASARRVIDISSDGRNNVGIPVSGVRDRLVADGITINGLTILNEWPTLDVYFQRQVVGGTGHFVVPAVNYSAFADAIYIKLLREVTGPGIS